MIVVKTYTTVLQLPLKNIGKCQYY